MPDAAPVVFRLNYETYTMLKCVNLFVADSERLTDVLRYAVTLIFDLLTLNYCSVPAVTWSNSVPDFGEIEKSTAEL